MLYQDYTKTQRVLEVYRLIRSGTATGREQLSELLGVSIKTITNDIRELREVWQADIVYRKDRYVLEQEGILENLKMTQPLQADDISLLLVTLMSSAPFMETKIDIIKHELMKMMPDKEAKKLEKILYIPKSQIQQAGVIEQVVKELSQVIGKGNKVKITYGNLKNEIKTKKYKLYTLACDQGKYYAIVRRDEDDKIVHLRLDRIKNVEILKERATQIDEFNLIEYLKKTWYMYGGEETKVKVRFANQCMPAVLERNMSKGELLEQEEEHFIYEFTCNGTDGIKLWLMGFMSQAEILEPFELRREIANQVKEMIKIYSK